jgi:hypothetical protein
VKIQQVEALQVKVEVLGKKIATLLQLLPALGERFGISMKQMTEQVPLLPPHSSAYWPVLTVAPVGGCGFKEVAAACQQWQQEQLHRGTQGKRRLYWRVAGKESPEHDRK